MTRLPGLLALVACLALMGCGPSGPKKLAVHGTVKYKGAVLRAGSIEFRSEEPDGTSGGSNLSGDGSYTIAADPGLAPGRYRVRIFAPDRSQGRPAQGAPGGLLQGRELLPEEYNLKSTLVREVTDSGPNTIDFDLP